MKQILALTLLLGVVISCECSAEEGKGKGGNRKPNANGQRRQGFGDPAQMATRMISQFDKDGDQKLDSTELAAMLTAMRERRAGGGQNQRGKGQGQKPGAGRRGQGKGGDGSAGGAVPKRPAAE